MTMLPTPSEPRFVKRQHSDLNTTFRGILHPSSTSEARLHQYLGIKYASIPARFRQSKLCTKYPPVVNATEYGPICPQPQGCMEELLFGVDPASMPCQNLKQDEMECLNLNITCPAGLNQFSRVPVMLWVHGGGDRGSGSHWAYDGAPLVRQSIKAGKPVILITFNFRIGFLGFAANPMIRDDNKEAGEEGTGNYGLRDQQRCLEWLHRNIPGFGGDPDNITLFGASSGAADIICHLLSRSNQTNPMFARAIIQSAVFEPTLPDVATAGWQLSRIISALHVSDMEKLREVKVDKLLGLGMTLRIVDDGVFFRDGWMDYFAHTHSGRRSEHKHPRKPSGQRSGSLLRPPAAHAHTHLHPHVSHSGSRSRSQARSTPKRRSISRSSSRSAVDDTLQPLIIGDSVSDSLLWSMNASLWTPSGATRRIKAICQSLTKASCLLRAYDITSYTPDEEIVDRVLELVNDARVAWPTECIAENAKRERGGHGVWRYVFDQEGPYRGIPHHAADIMYLFDTVPLAESCLATPDVYSGDFFDGPFDTSDDEGDAKSDATPRAGYDDADWETTAVTEYSYNNVRDAIQGKWLAFAYGDMPWREDKVFVFGPEGETGERSTVIFEGRRRKELWKSALEPLGHQVVSKVGLELSRGPG
ncbi:EstA protein [Ephemerocybe angulata]|uniref:Carboxylic ester hydrolase n=1 Tax=Ephemerocybe angulata TaxID=980116 RepID=A0A8H6HIU2_9AGAR|nr:EstA protein [Tulosesus angulatus]